MAMEGSLPTLEIFLERLKLSLYVDCFISNKVHNVEQLIDFDDTQLKDIGVEKPGHRKRMLGELKTLKLKCSVENNRKISQESENFQDKEAEPAAEDEDPPPPIPLKSKVTKMLPPVPPPRNDSPEADKPIKPEIPPRLDLELSNDPTAQVTPPEEGREINDSVGISGHSDTPCSLHDPRFSVPDNAVSPRNTPVIRSGTLPSPSIKRMAPPLPTKTPSLKGMHTPINEDTTTLVPEAPVVPQSNRTQHRLPNATVSSSPSGQKDGSLEQSASSPIMKIDGSFLNKMNEVIKRPAPKPPSSVLPTTPTAEPYTEEDKDEDASSDSDDDSSQIENEKTPANKRSLNSLLESELVEQGQLVSYDTRRNTMVLCGKSGFLEKRGGQNNKKAFKKRWVVFDENDLRYYKPSDKDTRSDCLQIVPVERMTDIQMVTRTKKSHFCLETPNRTFIFASDDHNEIGLWANVLMRTMVMARANPNQAVGDSIGGSMSDPDKEGWLKKQGHNVRMDWKPRYVVVKEGKVAYYRNYEDYKQDLQINCLNMALTTVKTAPGRCRILMKTSHQKDFLFEAPDEQSFQSWISVFKKSIQMALGDTTVLDKIQENPSNKFCADCGKRNPVYASVNLLVIVCDSCIGFHRNLGAQITKARSVLMDVNIWNESLIQLMQVVGNENANQFWEHKLPEDDKITPDTPSDVRYEFILSKYKERKYMNFSQFYGQECNLGEALRRNMLTNDIVQTLQLLICGASVYYSPVPGDGQTPYQLAAEAKQELQMELLRQFNGHYSAEEREEEARRETQRKQQEAENAAQSIPAYEPTVTWEKQGVLLKRGPRNNEAWRPRQFFMLKRNLYYQKENEKELIDLKKVIALQKGVNDDDPRTINVVLPTRTYYLKGETLADAEAWYTAIRNKQVFDVPIECQELNSKKIPLLVARCVDYVENYALHEEGIYRKNGSQSTIKSIRLAFNQDAPGVRLTLDEFPLVHDICGVLKLYLREGLPEPLTTNSRYQDFIANSCQIDHDTRLGTLYTLVDSLPEVNKSTFRCIILHLKKTIKYNAENKMTLENVIRVFAPIILNRGNSTNQQVLEREYRVLADILTYSSYLLNIDNSETQQIEADIEKAKKQIEEAGKLIKEAATGCKIDDLNQPVYLQDEQTSYFVKLTSKTTASDVCWYLIKLLSLSVDGNWALFEKISGTGLERPLHTRELVLPLVMESGNWGSQATFLLCLKSNYVAELTAQYQTSVLSLTGKLHWRKDDDSWKKDQFLTIKTGDLVIYNKEGGSELERLALHQWTLYIGVDDKKRKSPKRYGITLKSGYDKRYACTDDEKYLYRWISAILQIKYPSGIWTNLQESERRMTALAGDLVPLDQRKKAVFLGRKSTYRRAPGSSQGVQKEIQEKRKSLRNIQR